VKYIGMVIGGALGLPLGSFLAKRVMRLAAGMPEPRERVWTAQ
jgi:hypothetical protein